MRSSLSSFSRERDSTFDEREGDPVEDEEAETL
jgi:hypothetical protein